MPVKIFPPNVFSAPATAMIRSQLHFKYSHLLTVLLANKSLLLHNKKNESVNKITGSSEVLTRIGTFSSVNLFHEQQSVNKKVKISSRVTIWTKFRIWWKCFCEDIRTNKEAFVMAEEILRMILATEQTGDFQQWFLNLFQVSALVLIPFSCIPLQNSHRSDWINLIIIDRIVSFVSINSKLLWIKCSVSDLWWCLVFISNVINNVKSPVLLQICLFNRFVHKLNILVPVVQLLSNYYYCYYLNDLKHLMSDVKIFINFHRVTPNTNRYELCYVSCPVKTFQIENEWISHSKISNSAHFDR